MVVNSCSGETKSDKIRDYRMQNLNIWIGKREHFRNSMLLTEITIWPTVLNPLNLRLANNGKGYIFYNETIMENPYNLYLYIPKKHSANTVLFLTTKNATILIFFMAGFFQT